MENKPNNQLLCNITLFHFDQGYMSMNLYKIIYLAYGSGSEEDEGSRSYIGDRCQMV